MLSANYTGAAMSVLIGIAGGTGSGKTSLAGKLQARLGADRCLTIAHDSY